MEHGFFRVITSTRFCELLRTFQPTDAEVLPLEECLGRILAEDILSGEDIPALDRYEGVAGGLYIGSQLGLVPATGS